MRRAFGARGAWITLAWVGLGAVAGPAGAIEFFDGRLQIHGFAETRLSFGVEDFNPANRMDMYGWLQVLSIETEAEIAPDGWGPFDMVAAFARVEVKYDCVWNHACGTLQSVNAFGDSAENLPYRVQTGHRLGYEGGVITSSDRRPYWFADRARLNGGLYADTKSGQRAAKSFVYGSTNVGLFGASAGPNAQLGPFEDIRKEKGLPGAFAYAKGFTDPTTGLPGDDDAGLYMFWRTSKCKVGNYTQKSSSAPGISNRELMWGIDGCPVVAEGFNREIANPFADELHSAFGGDVNPVLLAINQDPTDPGFGLPLDPNGNGIPNNSAMPLRPGTEWAALPNNQQNGAGGQKGWASQGLFLPNLKVREAIKQGKYDDYDQNFSQNQLQWNHGASQQEEPLEELRELYLEFEAFESQLWVRAGKQTIVWGKTELFRNQDQWNPVDIAIGPLSSLEESRIAQYAVRGIWSFYEVGPFEDVRLELVTLLDEFEPTDIGKCGEPFVPKLACAKGYGLWVHGENGTGVAGEIRPEAPWNNTSGTEIGARVEFRWDRFSFALTDYYGYTDTPYTQIIFNYSRNVDPITGRPRHTQTTERCTTPLNSPNPDPGCLTPDMDPNPNDPADNGAIANHSINQSLFSWICAGTVGVAPAVDSAACAFTLFNSTNPLNASIPTSFATAFSQMIAGVGEGRNFYPALVGDTGNPKVANALNAAYGNPATNPGATGTLYSANQPLVGLFPGAAATGLGILPPEQQALYGCGPFYGTTCFLDLANPTAPAGVDLANAEASVILQSFTWFEGTLFDANWDTADASIPQPGTVDAAFNDGPGGGADAPFSKPGGLETGPAGTRYEDVNGDGKKELVVLPGAHYDPLAFAAALANAQAHGITVNQYVLDNLAGYNLATDWTTLTDSPGFGSGPGGCAPPNPANCVLAHHPFTGQLWSSAMSIASWNLLMLATGLGAEDNAPSESTLDRNQPLALGRCSYRQPQFCAFVAGLGAQARLTNSNVKAGGNSRFGRRNFVWASIGDLNLQYQKRNIFGFSTDFAEDTTKSSWGVEFTHVNDQIVADNADFSGLGNVDEFNLTVSVDRPTFINFLNANRTFFINSQLFVSYLQGYNKAMLRDGPLTTLLLVNANTGYFQDRFLVSAAAVYDFTSQSSAFLPSVQYRFTENFSVTIGAAVLAGGWKRREMGINQFSAQSDTALNNNIYVENGISPARDLDNFVLRLRYTY